ncbi:hypothetical protein [Streptomyces cyanogenus]|uniref:Uncharacterized protein n=1 Tax=Streptomyces cyanogenus TaxID=80860 RepID=A0ABX7TL26_STRCY|nr:hypothetical protein [Streptomyces cyanogenus]QTD97415.1 hypothetical protein S1361_08660 [Streptomyces cyanogenus]
MAQEHDTAPTGGHAFTAAWAEEDLGPTAAPFTYRSSSDGHGVVIEGDCPRCHGRTRTEYTRGLPGTGTKGLLSWLAGRSLEPEDDAETLVREVYFCECGHPHPNLPPDAPVGCGASWRITTLVEGGTP